MIVDPHKTCRLGPLTTELMKQIVIFSYLYIFHALACKGASMCILHIMIPTQLTSPPPPPPKKKKKKKKKNGSTDVDFKQNSIIYTFLTLIQN